MPHLPADVWAMTPADTDLLIRGWNDAQAGASGKVQAMTPERLDELIALDAEGKLVKFNG